MLTRRRTLILLLLACLPLAFFVLGTMVGLFRHVNLRQFGSYVCCPKVTNAFHISLYTTVISTVLAVVLGTPVAYVLAHCKFRGKEIVDTMVDLPLVLPPSAAGIALLLTFGKQGLGFSPIGSTLAVIGAQLFVSSPFFIRQARTGFESVSSSLKLASMTLGASSWRTFFRVTVPLAKRSLLAGTTMTWARALGEFGATLTFAGAFEGRTETMPIAIYTALTSGNLPSSVVLAATLVAVSFVVLITAKVLLGRGAAVA